MNTRNTRGFLSVPLLILIGIVLAGSAGVGAYAYFKAVPASETKEAALPEFEARVASSTAGVNAQQSTEPIVSGTAQVTSKVDTAEGSASSASIAEEERARLKREAALYKSGPIPGMWDNLDKGSEVSQKKTYDSNACMAQKKDLVPTVEAKYESWFAEWQHARTGLDSCYDTNSVPYCDGKMTDLNVEWQAKWSVTVESYYKKLDKCSTDDRRFGDVSSTLSSY